MYSRTLFVSPVAFIALGCACCFVGPREVLAEQPPTIAREFRAAWIATVANIDWPSRPGLPPEEQRRELVDLLDLAQQLRMNAVVLQVRPACDALYASRLEPWSPYLTGEMGMAPADGYDPLTFAVEEAHRRGIELHAWFNPYRALHSSHRGKISSDHVSNKHPDAVREYGGYQWLDPGDATAVQHSHSVIMDVVRRYDIDAVHFDDYFYPYPVRDDQGEEVPFPDSESWSRYTRQTDRSERLSRDDWRRQNVNEFLRSLAADIKEAKPWVRFGVSPFGIYRPGQPEGIAGFDAYAKLYADSRLWFSEGIVDYLSPQLYWPIDQQAQSFPVLLDWWQQQNPHQRHLWPGLYTSKVRADDEGWPVDEIAKQIDIVRNSVDAPGHIHFSIKAIAQNRSGLKDRLEQQVYRQAALPPATSWASLPDDHAVEPKLAARAENAKTRLELATTTDARPWLWTIQWRSGDEWSIKIVAGAEESVAIEVPGDAVDDLYVRTVDRLNQLGPPQRVNVQ